MVFDRFFPPTDILAAGRLARTAFPLAVTLWALGGVTIWGEAVNAQPKHTIGATAHLQEVSTGFAFPARIDTGAKSCSLHVEEIEVKDENLEHKASNIGKAIRFKVKNEKGQTAWIETLISGRVRIKSASNGEESEGRYKVRLRLQWQDVRKTVHVTLSDRGEMAFPLLIGRNFLRGDFLVDVELDNDD